MTMSDSGTLFPNILQPAAALKAYAPMGVKFWENQETALADLKEFAEGWFARRHRGMHAALEAVQHIGDAESPSDILQEYQNWLRREMELLAEDGKAYQQQLLRAGAQLSAPAEEQQALDAAAHPSGQPEEQRMPRAATHPSARPEAPQTNKRRTG
jgi:hypothetical protein